MEKVIIVMNIEKNIKIIQEHYFNLQAPWLEAKNINISHKDLVILDSLGYITYEQWDFSRNYRVIVKPICISYFIHKKNNRIKFWQNVITNFFSGVAVGLVVGVLGTLITINLL